MPQSIVDKVHFGADVPNLHGGTDFLEAVVPPVEATIAKEILLRLHEGYPCGWSIEIQDDMLKIWSNLHITYGYQMPMSWLTKGLKNLVFIGRDLVERIKAGCPTQRIF